MKIKISPILSIVNNIRNQRSPRLNIARLKQPDVAVGYAQSLKAALPTEDVAKNVIGHVERTRGNDWFKKAIDGECRAGGISAKKHPSKRGKSLTAEKTSSPYFSGEMRLMAEENLKQLEQLHCSQETRKFYQKLSASRKRRCAVN